MRRSFTTLRAGFALIVIFSPVKGLTPGRALVAGFFVTVILASPGIVNVPFLLEVLRDHLVKRAEHVPGVLAGQPAGLGYLALDLGLGAGLGR